MVVGGLSLFGRTGLQVAGFLQVWDFLYRGFMDQIL